MEKIQKIIANRGYTSRRKAEELIMQGKVYVDGKKASIGDRIDENANISIDGKEIVGTNNKVYFLLNKPRGVVSTVSDEKGRKTVVDFIDTDERIYPVGRLDYDTTGLLILTNDGDLANKLTHPKNKIIKTYLAKCAGIITKEQIDKLKKGIYIDDRKVDIIDFKVKKIDKEKNATFISISIIEGRNHIVKRLFENIGLLVDKLTRTHYDFLDLGNLKSGEYRTLSIKEVKKLYRKLKNNPMGYLFLVTFFAVTSFIITMTVMTVTFFTRTFIFSFSNFDCIYRTRRNSIL